MQDIAYCGQFSNYKEMLDKSGEWMYTSEGKIEWVKVCDKVMDFSIEPFVDVFAMGKLTGLIAYWRQKLSSYKIRPVVKVYDQNSNLVSSIYLDYECYSVDLHVFMNDNVGILTDDGAVLIYEQTQQIKLTKILKFCFVLAAKFYETGVVIMASDGNIYECEHFEKTSVICDTKSTEKPRAFEIVPPQYSYTNGVICFTVSQDGDFSIFSKKGSYGIKFDSPVRTIALSALYHYIAILLENSTLIVYDIEFTQEIYRVTVDFSIFDNFLCLRWLGESAPVAVFQDGLMFLSSDGTSPCWTFTGTCLAFTEIDSVFIQTQSESYRLVEVPATVSNVLSSMVTSDGGKLCQIFDERFTNPVLEAMENIDVETARQECIDTALFSLNEQSQAFFLNAAELAGNTNQLEKAILRAKILRTLRNECSMPLTNKQYEQLPIDMLGKRLCARHLHVIAAKIFERLGESTSDISESFSRYLIDNILDDDECLSNIQSHDFIQILFAASYAVKKGRMNLAKNLTEKEKSYVNRATLYSLLSDWQSAFEASAESCDSSSMFQVLATAIGYNDKTLVNQCIAENQTMSYFLMRVSSLIQPDRLRSILELAQTAGGEGENLLMYFMSFNPDNANKNVSNLVKLKELQKVIGADIHDNAIVGMSFNNTIRRLAKSYLPETAALLAKESDVDEKQWERIFVVTLIEEKLYRKAAEYVCVKNKRWLWDICTFTLMRTVGKSDALTFIQHCEAVDTKAAQKLKVVAESDNYVKALEENPLQLRIFRSNSW